MSEEIMSVETLEPMESGGAGLDLEEFEGAKVPIDSVEVTEVPSDYDENGNYVKGLKRTVRAIKVKTKPLAQIDKKDGGTADICASELINLKERDGKWGFSMNPNAKIQKLLKKTGATAPAELPGRMVTVRVRSKTMPDGTEKQFLGFII